MISIFGCREAVDDDLVNRSHGDTSELITKGANQYRIPIAIDGIFALVIFIEPVECHLLFESLAWSSSDQFDQCPSDSRAIDWAQVRPLQEQPR